MKKYTIKDLEDKKLIIFSAIMGSKAYGTQLPTSDTDIRGVFIQPLEDILGFGYVDQVADKTNDIVFYEIKRFLQLVKTNNPNILELLNAPEDCILYKDSIFDFVLDQKETFITKQCKMSFAGYAIGQIKKARGFNKKMNWEEEKMVRKNVLDFCYVLEPKVKGTMLLKKWLPYASLYNNILIDKFETLNHRHFGLANLDHSHNTYAMYYLGGLECGGIVSDEEKANDIQLISISKKAPFTAYLTFNKDAYSNHCKKYKEYLEWLENRNEDRFKMNKEHGKQYDSKNMAHCIRLLDMGIEIAKTGNILVRRPKKHINLLMSIRRGEMEFDHLLKIAEEKIKILDEEYEKSLLPNKVEQEFMDNLLITIRKLRYATNI